MSLLNPLMVINMSPFSSLDGLVLHALLQQCQPFHMLCLSPCLCLHPHPYHSRLPLGYLVPLAGCVSAPGEVCRHEHILDNVTDLQDRLGSPESTGVEWVKGTLYRLLGERPWPLMQYGTTQIEESMRGLGKERRPRYSSWLGLQGLQGYPLGKGSLERHLQAKK